MVALDRYVPLQTQVTIELTGRMLPGHRDRRRAHRSRRHAGRRRRPQLRHRPGRDERGAAPPLWGQPRPHLLHPQCGPPVGGRRPDALRPHRGGSRRAPAPFRDRVRRHRHRWVLRDHARPPRRRGRSLRRRHPGRREPVHEPAAASIYTSVPFQQDTSFLVVGERTNANGSKAFREAMLEGDWDTCVAMARDQVKEGSHLIDVCVDYTGADGVADMTDVASRLCTQSSVPLMVDSTEGPGRACRAGVDRRPPCPQLRQPRGGRRARHAPRHVPAARPRVRRGRRVHVHRRGRPGAHPRVEAAGGAQHPRHRRRALRPRAPGPAVRRAGPAAVDGHGGEPGRRHRDHRGDPCHQGRAARACPRSWASPTCRSG